MIEFIFFIRKQSDSAKTLPHDLHQEFLKSCESYIGQLRAEGRLLSAQPVDRAGSIISKNHEGWREVPFDESPEVIGGYYHILAKDLDEAIAIARRNPEFSFNPDTRIEVRPLKMKEETTNYKYPSNRGKEI